MEDFIEEEVPCRGPWGILTQKTFKIDVFGKEISGIPRPSQRVKMSHFLFRRFDGRSAPTKVNVR